MRTTRSLALALAAALVAAIPAAAQRGVVRGQVVDTRSGQPVAHAAVYLDNGRTATVADAQGRFEVKHVRAGTRALWADAPGYSMDVAMLEMAADTATVTLEMVSDPVRLATLTVSTSRLDRRARGYAGTARVFRERDLAGMWYSNLLQMVQSRAGVRSTACPRATIRRGGMRLSGAPLGLGSEDCIASRGGSYAATVFIDETRWIGGLTSLADFQLPEVARVEVYGAGREVHVFTRQFMDWVSQRAYVPTPIGLNL